MSVEFTDLLLNLAGVVIAVTVPLVGAFGWMVRRMDKLASRMDSRMDKGFETQTNQLMGQMRQLEDRMDSRFSEQNEKISTLAQTKYVDARFDDHGGQLTEIKKELSHFRDEQSKMREELNAVAVSVARHEGPVARSS